MLCDDRQVAETVHRTPWTFPDRSVASGQSVKGYAVEATDGHLGTVLWATYKPGKSYLVVRYHDAPDGAHVIVPAGAVRRVDHKRRVVALRATVAQGHAAQQPDEVGAHLDAFEPGILGGGFAWLYTDV
jgi:hypothetical protein